MRRSNHFARLAQPHVITTARRCVVLVSRAPLTITMCLSQIGYGHTCVAVARSRIFERRSQLCCEAEEPAWPS